MEIRGHEFRYSTVIECHVKEKDMIFDMKRGTGFINKKDGISYKNVFASYTHIHALNVPMWAKAIVENAIEYKNAKQMLPEKKSHCCFNAKKPELFYFRLFYFNDCDNNYPGYFMKHP